VALTHPMLHAHPSEITINRIRGLVQQVGPESPMVEYKERFADTIAKGVAALANTYGGLLLVGVSDDRQVKGVKEKTIEAVAEHCHSKIEPPYLPEIIPVPLGQGSDLYVLVLRVVPGTHPLPLLVGGIAWIRHQNTSHPADWRRLRDLFNVGTNVSVEGTWNINAPQMPSRQVGGDDTSVDFVLRSGLTTAVAPDAAWRPLPERTVDAYAAALDRSALANELSILVTPGHVGAGISRFHRKGFNRARNVRLEWEGTPSGWPADRPAPVSACATLFVPGAYGDHHSRLKVEIDVTVRFSAAIPLNDLPIAAWQVEITKLRKIIDATLATLTDKAVVEQLADLAGIDPIAVPQPRTVHLVTARAITEVLDTSELKSIQDAGSSHGAHLLANPARDLANPEERNAQTAEWLVQIALDAGLTGMQQILESR
jgi:Putative DNA-binding domain